MDISQHKNWKWQCQSAESIRVNLNFDLLWLKEMLMVIFNIDTLILIEYVKLNLGNGMITIDEFIQLMETQESRVKYDIKELREQFRLFDKVGF